MLSSISYYIDQTSISLIFCPSVLCFSKANCRRNHKLVQEMGQRLRVECLSLKNFHPLKFYKHYKTVSYYISSNIVLYIQTNWKNKLLKYFWKSIRQFWVIFRFQIPVLQNSSSCSTLLYIIWFGSEQPWVTLNMSLGRV